MSTTTPGAARSPYRVTTIGVFRSEWTKLISVRSPRWALLIAVVLTIGVGAGIAAVSAHEYPTMSAAARATFDPIGTSLAGVYFAELATGVLGALAVTGDYATGMIRASLTVVPRRLPVLWCKVGLTGLVSFLVMTLAAVASFELGQALLSSHDIGVSLNADGALRPVLGAGLSSALVTIIALAIGAILRNTAAAISTFVGVFFVLPPLASLLPGGLGDHLATYLPSNAASAVFATAETGPQALAPAPGVVVLAAYAVVLTAVASVELCRRDS